MKRIIPLAVCVLAASACGRPAGAPLVFSPSRIAQAVSSDVDLCRATSATVIMDRLDDADGPLLDEVLVQQPDEPCVWRTAGERLLPRGSYKLLVRFDAVPREGSACGEDVSVPIGAYLIPEVTFPFDETFRGIREEDFLSLASQGVAAEGLDFDPDEDGRDSLAEIAAGGDPCTTNEPPVVTVEQIEGTPIDEETIKLHVASVAVVGDVHELQLSITHENGAAAGSAEIAFAAATDGNFPVLPVAPAGEGWELTIFSGDDDASDGAASFDLVLRLDEPFVGNVTVRAFATLDGTTPIASAPQLDLQVEDAEDETVILDVDFQPLDRLDVPEVLSEIQPFPNESDADFQARRLQDLLDIAGPVVIRVEDEDLDDDVSVLNARLDVDACPALTSITREAGAFTFKWAAQNADAVAEAEGGAPRTCSLELVDAVGTVKGTAEARLFVSPLKNDPPSYEAPASASLGMPAATFSNHTVPFVVVDPDQIETAPACTPTLTARAGTTCTSAQAFTSVTCAPNGARDADRWPFAVTVAPSLDYFALCGSAPSFDVSVEIADTSPDGTDASLSFSTCEGTTAGCGAPFFVRTVRAVDATRLALTDDGAVYERFEDVGPVISANGLGLMRVPDGAGGERMGVVELLGPAAPRVGVVSPAGSASTFEQTVGARRGVADAAGRFLTAVRDGSGVAQALRVDASGGAATATFVSLPIQNLCGEVSDATGAFLADRAGNLYLTCNGDADSSPPARLVLFTPSGATINVALDGRVEPSARFTGEHIDVIVDPMTDEEWIVWPDRLGLVLIDTSSIGGALVTERVSFAWPAAGAADLDAHLVDNERGLYLFLYESDADNNNVLDLADNDEATLSVLRFEGGHSIDASTVVIPEGSALDSNGFSFSRILGRPFSATRPDGDPDFLIQPGNGDFPRIDIEGMTIVSALDDVELPSFGPGVFTSPDARFTMAPTGCDGPDFGVGVALFPWDGSPTQFTSFSATCEGSENPDAFSVNVEAHVAAFIDGAGDLWVYDFADSRAGLDGGL